MEITKEFLKERGWSNVEGSPYRDWYGHSVKVSDNKCFMLEMRFGLSNTVGRDWVCHIDNFYCDSVACVDIGTVEQFNKLMELMEIEYKLQA